MQYYLEVKHENIFPCVGEVSKFQAVWTRVSYGVEVVEGLQAWD